MYALTADGQQRVAEWLAEVSWPKPDLAEFHLKLIAAAAAGLADPLTIVDAQRRELLRRLRDAQRAAMAEPDGSDAALLLEGIVLRLQADLRWLEACEQSWTRPKEWIVSDAADTSVLRARGLRKHYGTGEGLVRAVDGVDLDVARRGDGGGDGAQRLREVDAAAPARRAGPALGRRGVAGRAPHRRHRREGPGPDAAHRRRLRLPGLPPDGGAHRRRERRAAGAAGRTLAAGGHAGGRRSCWSGSGSPTGRASCRRRCPAASGSGSRSPGR